MKYFLDMKETTTRILDFQMISMLVVADATPDLLELVLLMMNHNLNNANLMGMYYVGFRTMQR